jgi:hypothetical protein
VEAAIGTLGQQQQQLVSAASEKVISALHH